MLRRDTIFILETTWEPKVPTVDVMQQQVQKRHSRLAGSVRSSLGKFVNGVNKAMPKHHDNKRTHTSRLYSFD